MIPKGTILVPSQANLYKISMHAEVCVPDLPAIQCELLHRKAWKEPGDTATLVSTKLIKFICAG